MSQAKQGDTVKVRYRGMLEDGTVFDESTPEEPLQFTIGAGEIIPGFEQAVLGMSPGEEKRETIPSDLAYGPYREEMRIEVDRAAAVGAEVEKGEWVQISFPDGRTAPVMVADISESHIILDANHPLAGKTLVFQIELVSIA